jgi:hypothetical protein
MMWDGPQSIKSSSTACPSKRNGGNTEEPMYHDLVGDSIVVKSLQEKRVDNEMRKMI